MFLRQGPLYEGERVTRQSAVRERRAARPRPTGIRPDPDVHHGPADADTVRVDVGPASVSL